MNWNWQNRYWPNFTYDNKVLDDFESKLIYKFGLFQGTYNHINENKKDHLKINLICDEALKTSEIEGEYLNRDSLQASLRKNFGLDVDHRKIPPSEEGIAEMMVDLYTNFSKPLSQKSICKWNSMLMKGRRDLDQPGSYRKYAEPMQIVSGPIHNPKIHFEAPPSQALDQEMNRFIKWFNDTHPQGKSPLAPLLRASIAHLYFVCIHPFEDGNGRIARAIAEKSLSQSLGQPTLIALSITIEKHRKKYYNALDNSNRDLEINHWLNYFASTILEAQDYSQELIEFLIKKTKLYELASGKLNSRQKKVFERILKEGPEGFQGGLSAENYISITKTSRATTTRDLQNLIEQGFFIKKGKLKSTRYYLNL